MVQAERQKDGLWTTGDQKNSLKPWFNQAKEEIKKNTIKIKQVYSLVECSWYPYHLVTTNWDVVHTWYITSTSHIVDSGCNISYKANKRSYIWENYNVLGVVFLSLLKKIYCFFIKKLCRWHHNIWVDKKSSYRTSEFAIIPPRKPSKYTSRGSQGSQDQ